MQYKYLLWAIFYLNFLNCLRCDTHRPCRVRSGTQQYAAVCAASPEAKNRELERGRDRVTSGEKIQCAAPNGLPEWNVTRCDPARSKRWGKRATSVNKFLFNFGLIFLMCNFNLFASRVSGKFIFFCFHSKLCCVKLAGASQRTCVAYTTNLLKFLHKWFFDKVLLQPRCRPGSSVAYAA